MGDERGSTFLPFLAGIATGALLGVLFAPQSGKETREAITGQGTAAKEKLEDLVAEGKRRWSEAKGHAKEKAELTAEEVDDLLTFLMKEGRDLFERLEKEKAKHA